MTLANNSLPDPNAPQTVTMTVNDVLSQMLNMLHEVKDRVVSIEERAQGQIVPGESTDPTKPKVFIAVPSGRSMPQAQTMSAMVALTRVLSKHGLDGGFGTLAFPDVAEIRNIFLSIWYDRLNTSHLLFYDDDMASEPQLILDMLSLNQPLVGALCPKRKLPIEFAGRAKKGDCRLVNGFMEVDGIGGAIMLIRRDCVDAMLEAHPEIIDTVSVENHAANQLLQDHKVKRLIRGFDHLWVDGEKFSEDLSFCKRWQSTKARPGIDGKIGVPEMWANITHNVSHVGQHEYTGRYIDKIQDHVTAHPPGQSSAPEAVEPIIVGEEAETFSPVMPGYDNVKPNGGRQGLRAAEAAEDAVAQALGFVPMDAPKRGRGRPRGKAKPNGAAHSAVPTDVTEPAGV